MLAGVVLCTFVYSFYIWSLPQCASSYVSRSLPCCWIPVGRYCTNIAPCLRAPWLRAPSSCWGSRMSCHTYHRRDLLWESKNKYYIIFTSCVEIRVKLCKTFRISINGDRLYNCTLVITDQQHNDYERSYSLTAFDMLNGRPILMHHPRVTNSNKVFSKYCFTPITTRGVAIEEGNLVQNTIKCGHESINKNPLTIFSCAFISVNYINVS